MSGAKAPPPLGNPVGVAGIGDARATGPGLVANQEGGVEAQSMAAQVERPDRARVASVDVLRGLVMVVMALDHVRDFASAAQFAPEDLSRTTPAYFFTRWITHFCAPTFFFLAGVSASLTGARRTRGALARWLVTRGVWVVIAEFTIVRRHRPPCASSTGPAQCSRR